MELFLLRVHQRQIEHQCHAALIAAGQIDAGMNAGGVPGGPGNIRVRPNFEIVFGGIQNLLNAAANISKSCWGAGGKLTVERSDLRASLEITDTSPLANTDLRNHLEHYDERIDRWWRESERHNHVDYSIGPAARSIVGLEPRDIFRHFDPETGHIIFWGEHYDLKELVAAIRDLLPRVNTEASKPHWESPKQNGGYQ